MILIIENDMDTKTDLVTEHLILTFQCAAIISIPKTAIDVVHTLICAHLTLTSVSSFKPGHCVSSLPLQSSFKIPNLTTIPSHYTIFSHSDD